MTTYYEWLGVAPNATAAEVRAAYRRLARRNHPDVAPRNEATNRSSGRDVDDMAAVNEAWSVLGDPERRAAYDRSLVTLRTPGEAAPTAAPASSAPGPPAPSAAASGREPDVADGREPADDDWRLDLPITDGRGVRTLGLMVAVTTVLAVAALVALFTYAILWAG